MKRLTLYRSVVLLVGVSVAGFLAAWSPHVAAAEPAYPPAWYEPPLTASQMGIAAYTQSPILSTAGLPAVEQRLPDDPVVIPPYAAIGRYGGTVRLIAEDVPMFYSQEGLFTIAPDHKTILPNLAESYAYSEDGLQLTVRLRKGLKWSDGHPVTTADFLFAINDLQLNPAFQPVTPPELLGLSLRATGPRTLVYTFPKPSPFFINNMAQLPERFMAPRHYLEQFHPAYADQNAIAERLEAMGFLNWQAFMAAAVQQRLQLIHSNQAIMQQLAQPVNK